MNRYTSLVHEDDITPQTINPTLFIPGSAPEIISKPQNVSVIDSDSVRFLCEVTGAPKPTIWWYRGKTITVVCLVQFDSNIIFISDQYTRIILYFNFLTNMCSIYIKSHRGFLLQLSNSKKTLLYRKIHTSSLTSKCRSRDISLVIGRQERDLVQPLVKRS